MKPLGTRSSLNTTELHPYFSNLFSPLFVFIAVIFFTSKLAENSEIIAMFSTGMSFKRMMRPYMISAAIIAAATFMMSSFIIPKGSVTRLNFEDKYIKPKKVNSVRNVQLEVDSGVIAYIDNYNDGNGKPATAFHWISLSTRNLSPT